MVNRRPGGARRHLVGQGRKDAPEPGLDSRAEVGSRIVAPDVRQPEPRRGGQRRLADRGMVVPAQRSDVACRRGEFPFPGLLQGHGQNSKVTLGVGDHLHEQLVGLGGMDAGEGLDAGLPMFRPNVATIEPAGRLEGFFAASLQRCLGQRVGQPPAKFPAVPIGAAAELHALGRR